MKITDDSHFFLSKHQPLNIRKHLWATIMDLGMSFLFSRHGIELCSFFFYCLIYTSLLESEIFLVKLIFKVTDMWSINIIFFVYVFFLKYSHLTMLC